MIAANKIDAIYPGDEDPVERIRKEFEPQGIPVYAISAVSGQGVKELLYQIKKMLDEAGKETVIFQQEFFPEEQLIEEQLPYTVTRSEEEDHTFIIGMNLRLKKCWVIPIWNPKKVLLFFQRFLKETGILDDLEKLGIEEGDTVRMYGFDLIITNRRFIYDK